MSSGVASLLGSKQTATASQITGTTLPATVTGSSLTTVGALTSGSIASGFGPINIGANSLTAAAGSFTTLGASGNITTNNGILSSNFSNGVSLFASPGVSSVGIQFNTNSNNRFKIETPSASADLVFYYAGTTETLRLASAAVSVTGTLGASLDIESTTTGSGFIVKSPNGNRWRITVDNAGAFVSTAL